MLLLATLRYVLFYNNSVNRLECLVWVFTDIFPHSSPSNDFETWKLGGNRQSFENETKKDLASKYEETTCMHNCMEHLFILIVFSLTTYQIVEGTASTKVFKMVTK